MKLTAYSKAGHSTWVLLESLRLLLDAGEGVNDRLGTRLNPLREVLISHAHADHIAGLYALIASRLSSAHRAAVTPLRVTFPEGSHILTSFLEFLSKVMPWWEEVVELHPVAPGARFRSLHRPDIVLTALPAQHVSWEPCLAWRISQERTRLQAAYRELPHAELMPLIQAQGRGALSELFEVSLIFYSGDSKPLADEGSRGAALFIHEATFLDPDTSNKHSTLTEAFEAFRAVEARRLVLFHFSTRYTLPQIHEAVAAARRPEEEVMLLLPDAVVEAEVPVPGL